MRPSCWATYTVAVPDRGLRATGEVTSPIFSSFMPSPVTPAAPASAGSVVETSAPGSLTVGATVTVAVPRVPAVLAPGSDDDVHAPSSRATVAEPATRAARRWRLVGVGTVRRSVVRVGRAVIAPS